MAPIQITPVQLTLSLIDRINVLETTLEMCANRLERVARGEKIPADELLTMVADARTVLRGKTPF